MMDQGDTTESKQPGTFDLYEQLPPLPVPTLSETCERYLKTVAPLVDDATYADVAAAVAELQAPGGVGERLQAALEARGKAHDNWLSGWWEDAAYLNWPTPIPINSSIAISGDARQATGNQVARAAEVTAGALEFYLAIHNETFPPEVTRAGAPFDMTLLKRFFATNRMPGIDKDRIATFGKDESRHIVVNRNGWMYAVTVLDADLKPLSKSEIAAQFQRIVEAADAATDAAAPVAALTAIERPAWARLRDKLAIDATNRGSLDTLERALFHVALDGHAYPDFTAVGYAGLAGTPGNRWFDKSLTLIVDADGRFTLHGEHSPVDAGAWCPLLDMVAAPSGEAIAIATTSQPEPRALSWVLTPELSEAVARAAQAHAAATDNLDLAVFEFTDFGKELIKTFKMGPDPFLQMAYQIAYHRLHGRTPKTYESASTRSCRIGRTETIRVASPQSKALVDAFDDPSVSVGDKQDLARAAFAEHSLRGKECSAGFGVDRHMLGLALIAPEAGVTELPRLFGMEIHTRGWELTTAQVPVKTAFVNHFGPVMPDGYGIAYVIKDDTVDLSVSSFRASPATDTAKFTAAIQQAFRDMRALLEG